LSRVNVRVRPAAIDDVSGLVALVRSLDLSLGVFSGRPPLDASEEHLADRFAEIISTAERELLVAVEDAGQIVGMLAGRRDDVGAIDLTPVLHITHLMVAADHRRRGVGRALLAGAVHIAEQSGIDHLIATAASTSREGNRYLARLGFAPLVVQRIAPVSGLRRTLGMSDPLGRVAVLRRARLARQRSGFAARASRA
jgi:ribosomal protein S18 acetylase RimI-like enzyme